MKYIFSLLLIAICSTALAQQKKDSKIIVSVDTVGILDKVASFLYENGYSIEHRDRMFIASTEKPFHEGIPFSVKIRAFLKDTVLVITGLVAMDVSFGNTERLFSPIQYAGMKGSALRKSWEEMEAFAKNFGTITYAK